MALGRRSSSMKKDCPPPFELVRYRSFGRKRITVDVESWDMETGPSTPLKRHCSGNNMAVAELESLPQELLVKVICGVNHEDLKQLVLVSKPVSEATSIARELHFAYSTPRKVRANFDFDIDEIETPRAPRAVRGHKRLSEKDASELSVSLFGSPKRKGSLFMDMEIDDL
ncbi:F-box protein At1g61340 [Linum perenne]